MTAAPTDRLSGLTNAGVAIWLDDISRTRLTGGGLSQLVLGSRVTGVTTNPTIFAKALTDSDAYAEQLTDLALRAVDTGEAIRMITTADVRAACDLLLDVYHATSSVDGRVSIEVDPRLAHDTDRTIAEARQLWWLVDRPNLYIKIPATEAGLPAITHTLAAGISVNVTLIFSLERYRQVMEAFLTGLELARANGHDLTTIGSVASFFVSRVDSEVDARLEKIGSPEALGLRGKAAVANAQLAYQAHTEVFGGQRWQLLALAGANPQRPLWASTSTKNPDYRDVIYVEELIAPNVVNTMPEPTIHAFADHGEVDPAVITGGYAMAHEVMRRLHDLGIEYDDVTATLEREGVEKFEASWLDLIATVRAALDASIGRTK